MSVREYRRDLQSNEEVPRLKAGFFQLALEERDKLSGVVIPLVIYPESDALTNSLAWTPDSQGITIEYGASHQDLLGACNPLLPGWLMRGLMSFTEVGAGPFVRGRTGSGSGSLRVTVRFGKKQRNGCKSIELNLDMGLSMRLCMDRVDMFKLVTELSRHLEGAYAMSHPILAD